MKFEILANVIFTIFLKHTFKVDIHLLFLQVWQEGMDSFLGDGLEDIVSEIQIKKTFERFENIST